jgi:LPS O-antigen subunit length determinant protein (WzzB/FepE family)
MIIIPDTMRRPAEVEREELRKQLAEARAEIERKDRLIEQMREALRLALPEARSTHVEQTILAALVAERGE